MLHILDNPCWNALNSGNNSLAEGNEQVKFFPADVSPFVGLPEWNAYGFKQLYEMIPGGRRIAFMNLDEVEIPGEWDVIDYLEALQMVYPKPPSGSTLFSEIVHLHNNNIPQMMALTEMTHPGPFFKRTIEFGNYEGIFKEDELVSMAGQRMHAGDYVEISAVCTHPGHKGKGYASELISSQVRQIRPAAIPFLHVKDDNLHAIKLYKSLGFEVRKKMHVYSIRKK